MRILLVENDPSLASGIRLALKPEHYTVDILGDGRSALATLQGDEPSTPAWHRTPVCSRA